MPTQGVSAHPPCPADQDGDKQLSLAEFISLPVGTVENQQGQDVDDNWVRDRRKEFEELIDANHDGIVTMAELEVSTGWGGPGGSVGGCGGMCGRMGWPGRHGRTGCECGGYPGRCGGAPVDAQGPEASIWAYDKGLPWKGESPER